MAPESPTVAIVGGTGDLGFGMALRLTARGVGVVIGSRDAERAAQAAERVRQQVPDADVDGAVNAEAVQQTSTVMLCVPFASQAANLKALKPTLAPGTLLIDATVPLATAMGGLPTRTLGVWQGSAAQAAQSLAPEGVRVVSALHTVSAASLSDLDHQLDEDVLICGDRREDKRAAAQLIERVPGLRCVDAGRLEMARICEQLTALLIGINGRYKTHAGIRVTGLPGDYWAS